MASFDVALVELGHLLGLFKTDGGVEWQWFGDPLGRALTSLPAERERIGAVIRALLERPTPTGAFDGNANWEPIVDTNGVGLGVAWSTASPLQLGLGAKADLPIDGKQITLAALARLVEIAGDAVPRLGEVTFSGTFPVPDFLSGGEITGEVGTGANTVGLKASRTAADFRQLDYPNAVIAWDAARLAVFVLKAWIAQRAAANEEFFKRINDHLFPMLGDPAGAIAPFPLVAPMQTPPNFDAWRDSVLSTDNNATGALTFLWHVRALLTGNEDPNFLNGSFFFPVTGAPQAGSPPTLANGGGNYTRPTGTTGAWVGLLTPPSEPADTFTLVLDLETVSPARTVRIPLARFDGAQLTRPDLSAIWPQIVSLIGTGLTLPMGNEQLTAVLDGSAFRLSVLHATVTDSGFEGFDGDYDLAIRLENGQPPAFELVTPSLGIAFPPEVNDPEQMLGDIVVWALKAAAPSNELGQLITTAAQFIKDEVTGGTPDPVDLLTKVAAVAGQGQQIEISLGSDASLDLEIANGKLVTSLEFGPIEEENLPIFIGKLKGGITINPSADTVVDGFTFGFENLRLSNEGVGGGIVASLIPDMRQMPGFKLAMTYTPSADPPVVVTGGGKIPIQRTIGPLEIAALLIDVREKSFAVALDLGLELGPIAVAAYELGLLIHYEDGAVEPFLHGLGLSMDTDVIKLAGFFAAVDNGVVKDYVGGAVVSVAGYFELSAIGGYTQLPDGKASLFLFASLVAPLGGPPWFFITGVAGGFGYNRSLPAPGLMLEHPFLMVMRGDIAVTGDAVTDLKALSIHFTAVTGQHWVAAGIQFIAFGFIYGKVVVAIAFGNKFSMQILGMASFGIEPICYFEIGIEVTADEEKFMMRARLSPNSYIIHPDIFSLQGDFALCAWYADPHKGDFLFSIGGYHPLFAKPEHYPELIRVAVKATVYDFVHLSIEVFFCCTPQALMAGAKASLWAEFAGIEAGLDVYVDVLMKWDPFFLRARLGVHVWFVFFGRHEIGVDLEIWTPKFGGLATIDLALVEFDIHFGADLLAPPPPPLFEFIGKQLGVPAKAWDGGARTSAFNTDAGAGLFRIEFLKGRPGKEPPPKDEKQEGLDAANPVRLSPEWSFLVRTRLPLGKLDTTNDPPPAISGEIDFPLCSKGGSWLDRLSTLTVTAPKIGDAKRDWLVDYFPAANFGEVVPEAQVTSQDSISKLKTDHPSIALVEGMIADYSPKIPNAPALTAPDGEPADEDERYPVPLGAGSGGWSLGSIRTPFVFGDMANLAVSFSSGVSRRNAALADLRSWKRPPFSVLLRTAELQRFTKLSAAGVMTVASIGTGTPGVIVMSPPPSPSRPAEMFEVQLKTLPVRSNEPVQRRQMETRTRPKSLKEALLTPKGGVRDRFQTTFSVAAGKASHIELGGGGAREGLLRLTGEQTTRAIVFDRGGSVMLDTYTRGTSALKLPRGAAQVLLIGEGALTAPTTSGIERESILLAAGSREFAGHGCVAAVTSHFDLNVKPMDSLPGAELFEHATTLRVSFANPARDEGSFILKLTPAVERPAPAAEQVRWLAEGAQFRTMTPVVAAGRVALVMAVRAPAPWSVTVDVGPEWRLDGIVFVPRVSRLVIADLQRGGNWDLVDDAVPVHPRSLSTSVSLEATA